jgi:uncharacterized membrane protein YfcA
MDSILVLLLVGCMVGTLGTLIGAGGGFILIPLLLVTHPELPPETLTAISMAVVAANAVSGSIAYARSGRIDFKAGVIFALCTIPGSVLGVFTNAYIPRFAFHLIFGIILIGLAFYLFLPQKKEKTKSTPMPLFQKGYKTHVLTDQQGNRYMYQYRQSLGIWISVVVGYLSPLLGIGGGIIHVPALINWLHFPVFIATATSHFILAVMATVSVITHIAKGNYNDPYVLRMVICLSAGALVGAQAGAFISHQIKGNFIIRALAVCLAIVGLRILMAR